MDVSRKLDIIEAEKKLELQETFKLPAYVDWTEVELKDPSGDYQSLLEYLTAKVTKEKTSCKAYLTWLRKHITRVMLLINYINIYLP